MANVTKTVKSSGGDYTTLNAALAGMAGDLTTDCGGTGGAGILTIECYAMSDTTKPSTGTGYTTSSSYYINITVPSAERHDGKWNTNKYRLELSDWDSGLQNSANYTVVDGLQISMSHTLGAGYCISCPAEYITVKNCLLTRTATANRSSGVNAAKNLTLINTILWRHTSGVSVSWTADGDNVSYIYNCTISDCTQYGIITDVGTHTVTNCAVFNTNNDFANNNGTLTISYCASDDGDGTNAVNISPGATEADDWADAFVDYANGDFHVKDTNSVLYNAATDLSGTFTNDIDGDTRSQWDIGADEYVAAATGSPRSNPFSRPFRGLFGRGGF